MSNGPNRILDELAKLMTDAAGAAQGVRREMETAFRSQAERMLNSMDLVQREEFEAVREMALKARAENEKLSARLAELELASRNRPKKPAPRAAAKEIIAVFNRPAERGKRFCRVA
jgi:BMFP domain-containing protein YqiC